MKNSIPDKQKADKISALQNASRYNVNFYKIHKIKSKYIGKKTIDFVPKI